MKIFKRIIFKVIKKVLTGKEIKHLLSIDNINGCKHNSISTPTTLFFQSTQIVNLQNNPQKIKVGKGTAIRGELTVWKHGGNITIGKNSYIGERSIIRSGSEEGIKIGDNVLISHNVTIIDSDSHEIDHIERAESYKKMLIKGHPKINEKVNTLPIFIEDYVWISYNVSVLKGIKIGKGAIVGAGSVVTKNVPPFTVVAGNPAKVIKALKQDR